MFNGFSQSRSNWAAVMLLAMSLLALVSLSTLAYDPVLGAHTIPRGNNSWTVTWVMPGGHGYEAGLRPGDVARVVAVPDDSPAWARIEVIEGPRAGRTVLLSRRWPALIDLLLFAIGLEFLLAGLVVFHRAPDRPSARRFTILALSASATFLAFPAIGGGHPWALALEWFGSKVGMAAFTLFFLASPVPRWRLLQRFLAWAPVPILTAYSYTVLFQPESYGFVKLMGYGYMALGLLVSATAMAWPFLTNSPKEQRRFWPVALGSGIAAGIYLGGSLLPYLFFRRYLLPTEVAIAGLALLPLGFTWAMLRYPYMGVSLGPWAVVRTVFDTVTDPIFVVRRDGQLVEASAAGLALLGIGKTREATEPLDHLLSRLMAGATEQGAEISSLLLRAFEGEVIRDEDRELRSSSGHTGWMSISATPLRGEGGHVDMVVLACGDVTERKQREKERLELDRQKDEFLANVSHDLRTPLTAIKSSVGVVLANEPPGTPEPLHRMLANIELSANRMASMVEDLLELSRIQSGRVQLRLEGCHLRDLALRAVQTIEPLAAAREQKLELDLPPEPVYAVVDSGRLERALTNLLSNAHQHGYRGGTIRLRLRRQSDEAIFTVADDGPGIPESEQVRVFDRFYRLEDESSRTTGGSGLGLPITRAMVELHGGRAWVQSKMGAGTTFWIAIPTRCPVSSGAREVAL